MNVVSLVPTEHIPQTIANDNARKMCFISSLGFTCRDKDLRSSLSKNHMETTRLCPPKRDECTHHMHGSSFVERHYHSSNLVRELYLVSLAGRSSLHSPPISNFPSSRQFRKPQNSTKKSLFQITSHCRH